jgi:hypothetical protein
MAWAVLVHKKMQSIYMFADKITKQVMPSLSYYTSWRLDVCVWTESNQIITIITQGI